MKALERRQAILEALNERRQDKVANLAFEFNVTERTIRNDILELSLTYPIYTVPGRYNGGVFIDEDYYLGKPYLNAEQQSLLEGFYTKCDADQKRILTSILRRFGRKSKEERR